MQKIAKSTLRFILTCFYRRAERNECTQNYPIVDEIHFVFGAENRVEQLPTGNEARLHRSPKRRFNFVISIAQHSYVKRRTHQNMTLAMNALEENKSLQLVRLSTVQLAIFCGTLCATIVRSQCCSTNNDRFQRMNSLQRRYMHSCKQTRRSQCTGDTHTHARPGHTITTADSARFQWSQTLNHTQTHSGTLYAAVRTCELYCNLQFYYIFTKIAHSVFGCFGPEFANGFYIF